MACLFAPLLQNDAQGCCRVEQVGTGSGRSGLLGAESSVRGAGGVECQTAHASPGNVG